MTFQWTVIVTVLYGEIASALLLIAPFIPARSWKTLFQSEWGRSIGSYANYYFSIFMVLLGICFYDSVREMNKYSYTDKQAVSMENQISSVDHIHMKLFRAQRNFYIAGFSLFLWFVLRRLITVILYEASIEDKLETSANSLKMLAEEKETLETAVADLNERLVKKNEQEMREAALPDKVETLNASGEGEAVGPELTGISVARETELLAQLEDAENRASANHAKLIAAQSHTEELKRQLAELNKDYSELLHS